MTAATRAGHYNPDDPFVMDQVPLRHAALINATSGIRVRRQSAIAVDKILLIVASVLLPLGLILILVGWYGAAHTGKFYEQIDYLISGGLLGVALAGTGGFMYFGYWLSRQLEESRQHNDLALRALQRIEGHLAAAAATAPPLPAFAPAAPAPAPTPAPIAAPLSSAPMSAGSASTAPVSAAAASPAEAPTGQLPILLLATARGTLLHRPDCAIVKGKGGLRQVAPGTDGFRYCAVCDARSLVEPA